LSAGRCVRQPGRRAVSRVGPRPSNQHLLAATLSVHRLVIEGRSGEVSGASIAPPRPAVREIAGTEGLPRKESPGRSTGHPHTLPHLSCAGSRSAAGGGGLGLSGSPSPASLRVCPSSRFLPFAGDIVPLTYCIRCGRSTGPRRGLPTRKPEPPASHSARNAAPLEPAAAARVVQLT